MSEMKDGEVHIDEQDASGGSKEGVVRWVLLISLLAAILILSHHLDRGRLGRKRYRGIEHGYL